MKLHCSISTSTLKLRNANGMNGRFRVNFSYIGRNRRLFLWVRPTDGLEERRFLVSVGWADRILLVADNSPASMWSDLAIHSSALIKIDQFFFSSYELTATSACIAPGQWQRQNFLIYCNAHAVPYPFLFFCLVFFLSAIGFWMNDHTNK